MFYKHLLGRPIAKEQRNTRSFTSWHRRENPEKREEEGHRDTDPQISTHARKKKDHNKDYEAPTATRKDLEKEPRVVMRFISRRKWSPVRIGIPGLRFNAMPTFASSSISPLRCERCSANLLSVSRISSVLSLSIPIERIWHLKHWQCIVVNDCRQVSFRTKSGNAIDVCQCISLNGMQSACHDPD